MRTLAGLARIMGVIALVCAGLVVVGPVPSAQADTWCPASSPCNIFGSATPAVADAGPDGPLNLGVQFSVTRDMYATGVRFYKSAANTGTHTGDLWSVADNGTNIFRVSTTTFTNETASGWQTASFPAPVKLLAGRVYMASYVAPNGHYSLGEYFDWSSADAMRPVHTTNAITGIHGGFNATQYPPNSDFHHSNYWVDVVVQENVNVQSPFNMTRQTPAVPNQHDITDHVEVGTRFTSDINTQVVGMRGWYSGSWWTVPEFHLWKSDGTLLATQEHFDVDGYQGWYEVYFATSVPITAGQEYVVSHFDGKDTYGDTPNYFTAPQTHGPFHFPTNAGVYKYTGSTTFSAAANFPTTQTSTNFWVEPITSADANVQLSATVPPTLSFSVNGVAASSTCGDFTTTAATTSTSGQFNCVSSPADHPILGQNLHVATNAANGYLASIKSNASLVGASHAHILPAVSGTNAAPAAWPANGTEAFGYATSSSALSGTATRFRTAKWAGLSSTPSEIMSRTGVSGPSGETECVAFGASIASTTPADQYVATVFYTITPSF